MWLHSPRNKYYFEKNSTSLVAVLYMVLDLGLLHMYHPNKDYEDEKGPGCPDICTSYSLIVQRHNNVCSFLGWHPEVLKIDSVVQNLTNVSQYKNWIYSLLNCF